MRHSFLLIWVTALAACQTTPPATPRQAYGSEVKARIGATWTRMAGRDIHQLSRGRVEVTFEIDADGRVHKFKLVSNSANKKLAEISQRSVLETRLPPIPPAVLAGCPSGRMPADFDFTIYSRANEKTAGTNATFHGARRGVFPTVY